MKCRLFTHCLLVLAVVVLITAFASCSGGTTRVEEYKVTCHIGMAADTARLFIYSQEYDKLIPVDAKTPSEKGNFVFDGTIDGEHVACIRFNRDTVPLYFVISPDKIFIDITPSQVRMKGNTANVRYLGYLNQRRGIEAQIRKNTSDYRTQAGNFTLTAESERHALLQDSVLNDSLHRVTVAFINLGTPEATIVKHRFIGSLPLEQARKINH